MANAITDTPGDIESLKDAVDRYFALMYDSDITQFDRVFFPSARLHGLRDGQMRMLTADAYRDILGSTPSPRSSNAPREEKILLMDLASADQALVKVRVRINAIIYVDYLCYHRLHGAWRVTSKAFHIETMDAPVS